MYLNIFLLRRQVLKHNQYVEIKQFFKVGFNKIMFLPLFGKSSFLLISILEICTLGKKSVVYIFVYVTKYVFSLTSNHIFVHFNHYDTFYSDNKACAQRFIKFTDENLKRKVQIEDEFIYIMN